MGINVDLDKMSPMELLLELDRQALELDDEYYSTSIGAEAIRDLLKEIDLLKEVKNLRKTVPSFVNFDKKNLTYQEQRELQNQKRDLKRLRLLEQFLSAGSKPSWMVLVNIPILPPELSPMVKVESGVVVTTDLNDLYRRVINRNARLTRLNKRGYPI